MRTGRDKAFYAMLYGPTPAVYHAPDADLTQIPARCADWPRIKQPTLESGQVVYFEFHPEQTRH